MRYLGRNPENFLNFGIGSTIELSSSTIIPYYVSVGDTDGLFLPTTETDKDDNESSKRNDDTFEVVKMRM